MPSNQSRLQAISHISNRPLMPSKPFTPLEDMWAEDVFTLEKMQRHLPKGVFKSLKNTIKNGTDLNMDAADGVATAMKDWAISKGALYYSHIFYPLTNATAEKHDGFVSPQSDGSVITEFSGSLLVRGEPDGSSFPNGGIRETSQARGYTAWDVTSPAYIIETSNGATLCIPTVFISWTGEALDKKTPLLRSNAAMNSAATRVLSMLGETEIAPLNSSCGAEQEYFLVDSQFANNRPDLLLAGRTLFGAAPAKGQEFDDHYFGAIPERIQHFMQEVEERMYKLGIPAKTRHNEVAPGQFEIAPVYEAANVAADHQQMLMTLLKNTAKRHGLTCLLHEKPFADINGSGKHVNWSVGNATQGNLLDPGDTPHDNKQFLVFCGAVIRGVHKFGPLLRAVIASASNDHRLGANEAPPAIMSVYLGSQLEKIFNQIKNSETLSVESGGLMNLGVSSLPDLSRDAGDRNRTSPFAFTGNRFEFRAVGSSQSVAGPLVAMNTILTDSLEWIADQLEASMNDGADLDAAILSTLKTVMEENGAAIFGGDGYSEAWHKMAVEERGLANLPTCAEALPVLKEDDIQELFASTGVLSPRELASRYEVYAEQYTLSIEVEARLVINMAKTMVYPAAMGHLTSLADTAGELKDLGIDIDLGNLQTVASLSNDMMAAVTKLSDALAKHDFDSIEDHLAHSAHTIRPLMDEVRGAADSLEGEVADDQWPLATYQEMLFIK